MTLRLAIALDQDRGLPHCHFGEAPVYGIFSLSDEGLRQEVLLPSPLRGDEDEEGHGEHFGQVRALLQSHGVHAWVSRQFGRSIKNVARVVVPVVTRRPELEHLAATLAEHRQELWDAWESAPPHPVVRL